jgi:hypothetical protein
MKMLSIIALAALASPALAAAPDSDAPREKVSTLLVYGSDPCPRSSGDEIIVCARLPEDDRFRIPKSLRKSKESPAEASWSSRVQMLETVSRVGTPNSCSPVGSGGQSGCYDQFLRAYREERRRAAAEGSEIP